MSSKHGPILKSSLFVLFAFAGVTTAQPPSLDFGNLENQAANFSSSDDDVKELKLSGSFELENGSRKGKLVLHAKAEMSWHTYSQTERGGPGRTTITVAKSSEYQVNGPFTPDRDPHIGKFVDEPVEEFEEVVWSAPLEISEGVDPETLTISVTFDGQVCGGDGACILVKREVPASFAGYYKAARARSTWNAEAVTLTGNLEPKQVAPGGTAKLIIDAKPAEGWHIYKHTYDGVKGYVPTSVLLKKSAGLKVGMPKASKGLLSKSGTSYYEGAVTFTVPLDVPSDMAAGEHQLTGLIRYQTCDAKRCLPPEAAEFSVMLSVGEKEMAGNLPLTFSQGNLGEVEPLIAARKEAESKHETLDAEPLHLSKLALVLLGSFAGGLILNLMPCVLPVIGLKVLAFAEQAGQQRGRVFFLNVWYSAGLISVFLVLATLAAFLSFGWGEQFTLTWFKVALVGLVFAMALSFLGVWEIPIPGFAGGSKAQKLQESEGAGGAFFKGVFTTILATPCSGPFLGYAFGLTLTQPPLVTYLIFGTVGLGMASPYLLIGLFPHLLRFIPKSGPWMETFKQFMAFLLLGTVVYLFSTINSDYFIPTLTFAVGIWFACWLIGRVPITADINKKVRGWAFAAFSATAIGLFAFNVLVPSDAELPWKPYTEDTLAQARADGKTVMIDFTADWCPNCKWNLKTAINRRQVLEKVKKNDVVPLIADWTDKSDTIKNKLAELRSKSIPILAIYPAGKPESEVIILRDVVTQGQVLEALEQAGPSRRESKEGERTAARR